MPRYEYCCMVCDYTIEKQKSFEESSSVEICQKCGLVMNKVYNSFGIQFKGNGFYKTDNN